MKQLTKLQKEFILDYFFINSKYPGWRNIGEKLLTEGECIVAGEDCIWIGGIGNFIKTKKEDGLIGCLRYKFDLYMFLSSPFYKEVYEEHIKDLEFQRNRIASEIEELKQIGK